MLEKTKQLPVTIGSGFDDYDDDDADENRSSLIKGTKLKFLDGEWVSRDGPISPDTELVVINVIKALQKWVPGRNGPAVTQVLSAGEKFPDLDALNNAAPEEEWRDHFGKQVGPWEGVYAAYLVNMSTMETFTFVAPIGTVGSKLAVLDLKERIRLARAVRNAPVFAIVSLELGAYADKMGRAGPTAFRSEALRTTRWIGRAPRNRAQGQRARAGKAGRARSARSGQGQARVRRQDRRQAEGQARADRRRR